VQKIQSQQPSAFLIFRKNRRTIFGAAKNPAELIKLHAMMFPERRGAETSFELSTGDFVAK